MTVLGGYLALQHFNKTLVIYSFLINVVTIFQANLVVFSMSLS